MSHPPRLYKDSLTYRISEIVVWFKMKFQGKALK